MPSNKKSTKKKQQQQKAAKQKKKFLIGGAIGLGVGALILAAILIPKAVDSPVFEDPSHKDPIIYYENNPMEGTIDISSAPSESVKLETGKVVYLDGKEKTWDKLYKEQQKKDDIDKLFTFIGGTTLVSGFNNNEEFKEIILPEGIVSVEYCFNNNFTECVVTLPTTMTDFSHSFENAMDVTLKTKENSYLTVQDNIIYKDSGATLMKYPDWLMNEEFIMPDSVKNIATDAIRNNPYLKSIVFSPRLESIGIQGISGCSNITTIELPKTVKNITTSFCDMSLLESITIPDNCQLDGTNFTNCPNLQLVVSDDNTLYTYEDNILYNKDKTVIVKYMESKKDSEFVIPETITEISPSAFANNNYLTKLTIGEGIATVGTYFANCNELKEINLPLSMTSLKTMTFCRLPKLTKINYAGTMEEWLKVDKGANWMITSNEYILNCSDESVSYKGTA